MRALNRFAYARAEALPGAVETGVGALKRGTEPTVVEREARAEVDWEGVARAEAAMAVGLDRRIGFMGDIDSLMERRRQISDLRRKRSERGKRDA